MHISLDFTDFVTIPCNLSDHDCTFLVDSQADISILKINSLSYELQYDTSERIRIKGVTGATVQSLGTTLVYLHMNNISIQHKFHLVDDNISIPTDGIIGKDFIRYHRCCIDYDEMSFKFPNYGLTIPISSELLDGSKVLPARSEIFRVFRVTASEFPSVIQTREIAKDVFIPTTIAYAPETWIRVLNTTDENVVIPSYPIESQPLSDFDIFNTHGNSFKRNSRNEELKELLKTKIPTHAPTDLLEMCMNYSDIFAMPDDKPSVNNFYKQKLTLKDDVPTFVKNYRLPQSQKSEINQQVKKLLANDLIEMSQGSYNSPLIVVPKKSQDGSKKWRMCVDYRMLNKKLVPDKFPLPRIDDILDGLGRAKYFSVMDLQSGFHQIPLDETSRPATAFSTDTGFFQWKVLPFGLSVAPSSFSRMMTIAFAGLSPDQAFIYMDDLIVIGMSEKHHLKNLKIVFDTCRKCNLKLNPDKCEFLRPEVSFLGHKCTAEGLLPDPKKIAAVKNYPRPKDKAEIKRFVAFANYYRRFIRDFSGIVQPLTKLTSKRVEFCWTNAQEEAFQKIKQYLITPPILRYPDFSREFTVTVDASQYACGGVLSQNFDGEDLPITYISRTFKKGELNKPVIEKELLAIHYAVTTLRPYLYGRPFTVRSDHKPLIFLYNLKNPASKLTRVRLELEEYDFVVEYLKGSDNVAADALSRISIQDLKEMYKEMTVMAITRSMTRAKNQELQRKLLNESHLNTEQESVPKIIEIMGAPYDKKIPRIRTTSIETNDNEVLQIIICAYLGHKIIFELKITELANEKLSLRTIISKVQNAANKFKLTKIQWPLNDDVFTMCSLNDFKRACNEFLTNLQIILINSPKFIDNEVEKNSILSQYHDDPLYGGHCGQKKLYAKIRSNFYWRNLTKDIAKYVKNCQKCQVNKPKRKNVEHMEITPTPQRPFDVVIIDTVGPLPTTIQHHRYALTMICDFSKYLVTVPLRTKTANEVAKAIFEHFILRFGPMREIRTDMGTEYRNEVIRELCKLMNITQSMSTAYHHQTVGTVERNHRVLNEYLRSYLSNEMDKWDTYLHYFTFCYNITQHSSNDNMYSPYELIHGRKVNIPNEFLNGSVDPLYNVDDYVKTMKFILQDAHAKTAEMINKMKMRNKEYLDKQARPLNIEIGSNVYVENEPYEKFNQKYSGPYKVIDIQGSNAVIQVKSGRTTIHKNRLRIAQ